MQRCMGCQVHEPTYRCKDCYGGSLFCQLCMVNTHLCNPLHRIEVSVTTLWEIFNQPDHRQQKWNNAFFERVTLKDLGLRIQLGHEPGKPCLNPKTATNDDFVVVDCHGVHSVALSFCDCDQKQPPEIQLLRAHWYPATGGNPKSAATFGVLEQFHLVSFETKCSGFKFYNGLARLTDNSGIRPEKVCFQSIHCA